MNEQLSPPDASSRLDTVTLETRAQHLPLKMREHFVWLGTYLRENCNRDYETLTAELVELGFNHAKTTWSKVIRGQWKTDAKGSEVEHPIISEERFIKAVTALRNESMRQEQVGAIPFIPTPTSKTIMDYVTTKRAEGRVCKFGVIIGETGTQKTATLKEYRRLNNHTATALVEAPERPSMAQFMTDLAREFGYNAQSGYQKKKDYVLQAVKKHKMIIVENVQRLYDPKLAGNQPIFNFLQKLQEDTGCTVIITFTPTFEATFTRGFVWDEKNKRYSTPRKGEDTFFEQFIGRAGGIRAFLRLKEYPTEADVLKIGEALKLTEAKKHQGELYDIACEPGRVRRLFEVLQQAKADADADREALTIEHVRAVREE